MTFYLTGWCPVCGKAFRIENPVPHRIVNVTVSGLLETLDTDIGVLFIVDASAGDVDLMAPLPASYAGKEIIVKKPAGPGTVNILAYSGDYKFVDNAEADKVVLIDAGDFVSFKMTESKYQIFGGVY